MRRQSVHSMAGTTILKIIYGIDTESESGSRYFKVVEKAVQIGSSMANAGVYLGTPTMLLHLTRELIQDS